MDGMLLSLSRPYGWRNEHGRLRETDAHGHPQVPSFGREDGTASTLQTSSKSSKSALRIVFRLL